MRDEETPRRRLYRPYPTVSHSIPSYPNLHILRYPMLRWSRWSPAPRSGHTTTHTPEPPLCREFQVAGGSIPNWSRWPRPTLSETYSASRGSVETTPAETISPAVATLDAPATPTTSPGSRARLKPLRKSLPATSRPRRNPTETHTTLLRFYADRDPNDAVETCAETPPRRSPSPRSTRRRRRPRRRRDADHVEHVSPCRRRRARSHEPVRKIRRPAIRHVETTPREPRLAPARIPLKIHGRPSRRRPRRRRDDATRALGDLRNSLCPRAGDAPRRRLHALALA